jgi:transposase InsO family protein
MSGAYPVEVLCETLGVSRSGYYDWLRRGPSARVLEDARLAEEIGRIHRESRETYGSPRVAVELRARGRRIGRNRVARLMRVEGLYGRQRKCFRPPRTTDSRHGHPVAPNRLKEAGPPARPNAVWSGDITYIPTDEGWDFLAVVLDHYSDRAVGHGFSECIDTELTLSAWRMARTHRRPAPGLIFHSDRGCQYASGDYSDALAQTGALASMSRTGCPYDNAKSEAFFSTLKTECVHRHHFRTRAEARRVIFDWIETFYNPRRRHSANGYLSPVDFENLCN